MREQRFRVFMLGIALLAGDVDVGHADDPPGASMIPMPVPRRASSRVGTVPASSSPLPPALPSPPAPSTRSHERVQPGPGAASPLPPVSLAELESLALRNNPTIRAAEALVIQQQGLLRQLTRYPNPTAGWVQSTPSRRSEGATQGAFI